MVSKLLADIITIMPSTENTSSVGNSGLLSSSRVKDEWQSSSDNIAPTRVNPFMILEN